MKVTVDIFGCDWCPYREYIPEYQSGPCCNHPQGSPKIIGYDLIPDDCPEKIMQELEGEKMIEILVKEYKSLLESQKALDALEAAGVDNWEGYEDAVAWLEEDEE